MKCQTAKNSADLLHQDCANVAPLDLIRLTLIIDKSHHIKPARGVLTKTTKTNICQLCVWCGGITWRSIVSEAPSSDGINISSALELCIYLVKQNPPLIHNVPKSFGESNSMLVHWNWAPSSTSSLFHHQLSYLVHMRHREEVFFIYFSTVLFILLALWWYSLIQCSIWNDY